MASGHGLTPPPTVPTTELLAGRPLGPGAPGPARRDRSPDGALAGGRIRQAWSDQT